MTLRRRRESMHQKAKLWVVWLSGLGALVGGVALLAYHVRDVPYTWNVVGLGSILAVLGFMTLIGTTASLESMSIHGE